VRNPIGNPPRYQGLSRPAILTAITETLERLGTDYIDIYYLHQPDYETPIEETLETLAELHKEGKIRFLGVSNYAAWQVCEMLHLCKQAGWPSPWISQPMYNLLARGIEQEYVPFARRFGVSCICYNPLAGGLLTGKQDFQRGPLPGTRFDANSQYQGRYWHARYFEAVEALRQLARRTERTLAQLALTWILQQPGVNSVLIGASSLSQLEENLRAAEGEGLDADALAECDRIWRDLRGPTPIYNR
jgi:aryl-alcohol dehydrogenase-like predicted oxidoreductase